MGKCPIGSYQSDDGQTSCKICPEGGLTSSEGARAKADCYVAAHIIRIVPALQVYKANVGDTVVIECSASGSPVPLLSISNTTVLAPEAFRGKSTTISLP